MLVIATLDAIPDPPAVNPSPAQCKVLQLHACACDAVSQNCESLVTSYTFPESLITAVGFDHCLPCDRMVHTGWATDSSPPRQPSARQLSFKS